MTPQCFGLQWSPTALECKGGYDPAYVNPKDNSRLREKCSWYAQCAPRTCASNLEKNKPPQQQVQQQQPPQQYQPQFIPSQALVRPTVTPAMAGGVQLQPPPRPFAPPQQQQQYQPQYVQQPQYQPWQYAPLTAPPHIAYYGPPTVPVSHQQPGMQMLSYLAVPEPVLEDVPWWKRLGFEILRAMGKSAGHTVANSFDHVTITKPRTPVT